MSTSSQVLGLVRDYALGGSEMGDERRYLQERVCLFTRVLCSLLTALYVLIGVVQLVGKPDLIGAVVRPERALHLAMVLLIGLALIYCRKGERPAWALHAVEGAGTVTLCWAVAVATYLMPSGVTPELLGLMACSLLLVLRAALVPSRAVRTAVIGLLAAAPLAVRAGLLRAGEGADLPPEYRWVLMARVPLLGAAMVGVTTLVSRVIYGLRVRVREAMEVGQYRLEKKLGEGGMGMVYKATHRLLRRPTAIKLLPPDRAGARAVARFEREVVQTSRLAHPATVAVYDYGRTPEGVFYYAMELLDGVTLEDLVAEDGPQPPGRVAHIVRAIAESLAEAHAVGLVHRDIKPANVMLCHRGGVPDTVKVLDFGLVKELASAAEAGLTHGEALIGTPLYLPPEAVTAPDTVDARSDLYMLGGTAYYLLTGTPVFRGGSIVEICGHHVHTQPDHPSKRLGRDLPAPLEALVLHLLRKKPADRPATATEVADRLTEMLPSLSWTQRDAQRWWSARPKPA